MSKYIIRYLIFWLPAILVVSFFDNASMLSHVLQWFFASFMLFGWAANTGMAAYRYPRNILSLMLAYVGLHMLLIVFMYTTYSGSTENTVLKVAAGLLSFQPLTILLRTIRPFTNLPHELVLLGMITALCIVGYIAGIIHRRINPSPYSPRIQQL